MGMMLRLNNIGIIFLLAALQTLVSCTTADKAETNGSELRNQSPVQNQISAVCENTEASFACVEVVEVYDGDTIFVNIAGQHSLFGRRMGVRVAGVDTPEIKTRDACEKKKAQEAKVFVENIVLNAKRVDLVSVDKDKFFRILGTVIADGKSVAQELIARKLAYPYSGEKKQKRNWCL